MSTQDLSEQQNGSERDIEEEETLFLDLNYPPPSHNVALESTFTSSSPLELHAKDQRWSNPQATNNVNVSDDDVVILSSPRSFLEARKNSRRNAEVIMVNDDDDIEMQGHLGIVFDDIEMQGHLEIAQQNKTDTDLKLCLELFNKTETENVQIPTEEPSPEAPTFTCPICMDQLTEETSTKCGHIFCKECIEGAMAVNQRCPTCRKKLKRKISSGSTFHARNKMKPIPCHNKVFSWFILAFIFQFYASWWGGGNGILGASVCEIS